MLDTIQDVNIEDVIKIAREAGQKILDIYGQENLFVEHKKDLSPLTLADKKSHDLIAARLKKLYPSIPVLSEEDVVPYEVRKDWNVFWLVDPLDGTKEFIKRNGEFTVNIALIHGERAILGVIYIPVKDEVYYAEKTKGSYKIDRAGSKTRLSVIKDALKDKIIVVASRSHMTKELEEYVEDLKNYYKVIDYISAGSSLKFCLVAEGKAHIYPRLGPTMEWDTASGQVIVEEAGGSTIDIKERGALTYNKSDLHNNFFISGVMAVINKEGPYEVKK